MSLSAGAVLLSVAAYGDIYVANGGYGTVGAYTNSGAAVNTSLISSVNGPVGLALSGSDLFITNNTDTVGEYTTSGATINADLISGLQHPGGIVVTPVPATFGLVTGLAVLPMLLLKRRWRSA